MVGASSAADAGGSAGADTAEPRYSSKAPALPYRGGPRRLVARPARAGEAAKQGHGLPFMRVSGALSRSWSHLDVFICLQTSTIVIVRLLDTLEKPSGTQRAHDGSGGRAGSASCGTAPQDMAGRTHPEPGDIPLVMLPAGGYVIVLRRISKDNARNSKAYSCRLTQLMPTVHS